MVTRPFDGRELGERIKQLAPPLPELTVFGMMLGSGPEIRHFMRAFKSLTSFVYVTKRLSRALPRRAHAWPRHDAHQRQRAGRSAGEGGDGPQHPGLAFVAGEEAGDGARRRRRRAGRARGQDRIRVSARRRRRAGVRRFSARHRAQKAAVPARADRQGALLARHPRRTPATACAWRRRSAAASTRPFLMRPPGSRPRSPRDPTARRASCPTSSIAPSRGSLP